MNNENSFLTPTQLKLLKEARAMRPEQPPSPWTKHIIMPAAGVIAGGWTKEEDFLLISNDGYSIYSSDNGSLVRYTSNQDNKDRFSFPYLEFRPSQSEETIRVFGINGGDGLHITDDGWELEVIYPWWPHATILIRTPFLLNSQMYNYLDRAHVIQLKRVDLNEWVKCGFAESGRKLAILGSGGVEVFLRE